MIQSLHKDILSMKRLFQMVIGFADSVFPGRPIICLALFLSLIPALSGCSVGPDYIRPETEMPSKWQQRRDPAWVPQEAVVRCWWKVFDDPILTWLIEQAAESNLDIRVAAARVNEARSRIGVVTGELFPTIDAVGTISRQRYSENGLTTLGGTTETSYSAGFDASWEIDLFGRIRRSIEVASASFQASEEDLNDVMITLFAEVARTYVTVRAIQARLAAANGNIESQKQVIALTQSRFKYGLTTGLAVAQAERVLAGSESEVPLLRIELARAIHTIGVLLGRPPGTFYKELSDVKSIPIPPDEVAVGIPADLLRRRPDIRRAERELAAQSARIGIATADLYPRFSLAGFFGYEALDAGEIFESGSRAFHFGPSMRWLLFDGNRVRNRINVEDALTEQALYRYEQTVLNALNEAENALTQYLEERVRLEALKRAVKASRRSLELAVNLYKEGLTDFQNVLDAQRAVFVAENQFSEGKGNTTINLVQLYKALGGGWNPCEASGTHASGKSSKEVSDQPHKHRNRE